MYVYICMYVYLYIQIRTCMRVVIARYSPYEQFKNLWKRDAIHTGMNVSHE